MNSLSHCEGERRGGEGGGGGGPLEGVGPENHIKLATYSTKYRIQNTPAAKLEYLKLPMYLFFFMAFGLITLIGANPLLGPLEVGPPLPMALEMDFPPSKSLPPAPYKQQLH